MAKGQKRKTREAKKPKQNKTAQSATATPFEAARAKPPAPKKG